MNSYVVHYFSENFMKSYRFVHWILRNDMNLYSFVSFPCTNVYERSPPAAVAVSKSINISQNPNFNNPRRLITRDEPKLGHEGRLAGSMRPPKQQF